MANPPVSAFLHRTWASVERTVAFRTPAERSPRPPAGSGCKLSSSTARRSSAAKMGCLISTNCTRFFFQRRLSLRLQSPRAQRRRRTERAQGAAKGAAREGAEQVSPRNSVRRESRPNYSDLPFPEVALEFDFEVVSDRRGRRRLLVAFLVLVFAFAPRLVFFADRLFRVDAPGAPIRKSSRFAPLSIFWPPTSVSHPDPPQVFCGLSGSRYLAAILPPERLRVPASQDFVMDCRAFAALGGWMRVSRTRGRCG